MLIKAGAALDAVNGSKQAPVDVAKMNGEKDMVAFLTQRLKECQAGQAA